LRTIIDRLRSKLNRTFTRGAVYTLAASVVAVFALPATAMAEDNYYKTCGDSNVSCQTGVTAGLVEGECMTTSAALASTSVWGRRRNSLLPEQPGLRHLGQVQLRLGRGDRSHGGRRVEGQFNRIGTRAAVVVVRQVAAG
jgi:hypothetical protein